MTQKYLKTSAMAKRIGLSASWLKKQKEILFKEGRHYIRPPGLRVTLWSIQAMDDWLRGDQAEDPVVNDIIKRML